MSLHPLVDQIGGPHDHVSDDDLDAFVTRNLEGLDIAGKKVVLVIPDGTRSCPLPLLLGSVYRNLIDRVASLTTIVALGTHSYMSDEKIAEWVGAAEGVEQAYPGMTILNHEWADPQMIVKVGTLGADEVAELSQGVMKQDIDVELNRHVVEADVNIVIGPVFPHEVVGISGGNKYFIPGCATHEVIDQSHWIGALIGVDSMIGRKGVTPVRAVINAGSALIPGDRLALCVVCASGSGELEYASFGTSEEAWEVAAEVAAASHVVYVEKPFTKVLAMMPERYDDIWTAAKGCYKAQPAMAEGGEVIIYAPHVTEVSEVHREIYEIGYHCIDYFIKQWDRFKDVPKGTLAHSTHVRGGGTYDPETGVETNKIKVTLCTQIPEEVCHQVNLGYLPLDAVDVETWKADPEVTVMENAGEILYRLASELER